MKYLLLITIVFLPRLLLAQVTLPTKDGKIYYEYVDSSVIATKDVLYGRAKSWFTNAFQNAKYVIQNDDVANGIIMGKGTASVLTNIGLGMKDTYRFRFSADITCKENKYRIRVYDFYEIHGSGESEMEWNYNRLQQGKMKKQLTSFFTGVNEKVLALMQSAKKSMTEKINDF